MRHEDRDRFGVGVVWAVRDGLFKSQAEFGRAAGWSQPDTSRYAAGRVEPGWGKAFAAVVKLGLPLEWWFPAADVAAAADPGADPRANATVVALARARGVGPFGVALDHAAAPGTVADVARLTGDPYATLQSYRVGRTEPPWATGVRVIRTAGLGLGWFFPRPLVTEAATRVRRVGVKAVESERAAVLAEWAGAVGVVPDWSRGVLTRRRGLAYRCG